MRLGLQKRGGLWQKIPELWQDYHIDTVDLNQQESVRDVANGIIGIYRGMQVLRSNVLYGPTPITSGPPAYRLVEDGKLDSIYDIYSHPDLLKQVIKDNTEAAKSRIVDADYATETTALTRNSILQQAATSMIAQANASKNSVLTLIQ